MKQEYRESLLMDRALGELEPEVAALLDEYLGEHPEARREADRWVRLVAVAGEAVRAVPPVAARARHVASDRGGRSLGVAMAMAALALAVAVGLWWGRVRNLEPAGPLRERPTVAWADYEIAYDPAHGGFIVAERAGRP